MTQRKSHEHKQAIIADYEAGLSLKSLADKYGYKQTAISACLYRWRKELGLPIMAAKRPVDEYESYVNKCKRKGLAPVTRERWLEINACKPTEPYKVQHKEPNP